MYCVDKFYFFYFREICFGEYYSKMFEGFEEVVEVDKFYMYFGFSYDCFIYISVGDYDFVFYYFKRFVIFYSCVSLVCLFDEDFIIVDDVGWVCYVIGWGYISENGNFFDVLYENEVLLVLWEECNKERLYNGYIKECFMCVGYEEGGRDVC